MNFLYKRSILSRPRIFQEGGSNIFLPDAKPYEVAVPIAGPSANPAVSNKPVEINTTGLADTFNKQKDLSYKWAELQFKYKELESKEGRDYLDAMRDMYKNVGNTSELIKAYGGTGSLGIYNEQTSAELSRISDLHSKAALALGAKDPRGFANAVAEMGQLSTQNTNLKFRVRTLDKMLNDASEGKMGYLTKRFMDSYFNHIQDPNAVTFEDVLNQGTYALGMKIQSKDISDLLDNYKKKYIDFKPVKTDVGVRILPSGLVQVESKFMLPSRESMRAEMKRDLLMDERGKSYLHENGINPDNPNSKELDSFIDGLIEPTYQALSESYGTIFNITGSAQKDVKVVDGSLVSIEKEDKKAPGTLFKPEKMSEAEKKVAAALAAIADKYGEGAATDPKIIDIVTNQSNYEKRQTALEARLKEMGLVAAGGGAAGGIVSGTEDLPNTLEGIKTAFNLTIDPQTTKEFIKDGVRYLVTIDENVTRKLRKYRRATNAEDYYRDEAVRDIVGAVDDTDNPDNPKHWNTNAFSDMFTSTTIYNLGPATDSATSGGTTNADWLAPEDKSDLPNLSPSIISIGSLIFNEAKVNPTSAYRTEEENELAKGAPNSYHRRGDALDYSWNEELFKRMTTPGDPLYERMNMLGYRAYKHDPSKTGYGTALHIHIEPFRRIDRPSVYEGVDQSSSTPAVTTTTTETRPQSESQYNVQERSIEEIMEEKLKNKEKIDLSNQ